jgi:cysteine desulfurase
LETKGFEVSFLDVDQYGRIDPENLINEMKESTILVSLIWGNNELGSLNDMDAISTICLEKNVFLHTDATQVISKVDVDLSNYPGLTFLSFSGHKFHGPKGIGGAFIRKDRYDLLTKITPLLHGGGQEQGIRSGTLPVHNIVGIGKAAELAKSFATQNKYQLLELEHYLTDLLKEKFNSHIVFNNDVTNKIPGIISVQFKGVNNEILVKKLAPIIAASTGSACSSSKPSHVLAEIGLSIDQVRSTLRFSMSSFLSKEDLNVFKQL